MLFNAYFAASSAGIASSRANAASASSLSIMIESLSSYSFLMSADFFSIPTYSDFSLIYLISSATIIAFSAISLF